MEKEPAGPRQARPSPFVAFPRWFYSQPLLLLSVTAMSWAGNAVAGQFAKGEVSPFALTFLRWFVVCALLLPLYGRKLLNHREAVRATWPFIFLIASFGFTGFNALFYIAAYHTSAVNMGILQGAIPVIVLLGAFLVYGTPVTWLQGAGVALTMAGVALVATGGDPLSLVSLGVNFGDLLMLVACLLYSGYTIALKRRPAMDGLAFFSLLAISAAVSALPLFLLELAAGELVWPTSQGWLVVLFVAFFPSSLAQIFYLRGVDLIGPGRAGVFVNLVPVFAAAFGVALLGEPFRYYHALALLLVVGGIWLTQLRRLGGSRS